MPQPRRLGPSVAPQVPRGSRPLEMCPGLEVCQDFALTCPWCLVWFLRGPGQQGNPCWALSVLALARSCLRAAHRPTSQPPAARIHPPSVHTACCLRGAAALSSAWAEGLQGNYLLLPPFAKPIILSAQTLQSSGQEAKVNFEKVFKRPKHKHRGGCLERGGEEVGEG